MLVICDFDGTITLQDITNVLLDHFTGQEWRDLLPAYRSGQTTHLEIMQGGYQYLTAPEKELLDYAREHIQLRPNFEELVEFCKTQNWPFAVVSGGLDFYIKAFLDEKIPYYCYRSSFDQYWRVDLPESPVVDMKGGQDFKVRIVEELQQKYPGLPTVFIGDGFNDWKAASHADYLFAVTGSRLAELSQQAGKPCTEFTDFAEVVQALGEN